MNEMARKDVRRIVVLLTASVATGCLLAGVMLYNYNHTGRYIAGQTILDPKVMDQINSQTHKGKSERLVFEKTDFTYYDSKTRLMEHVPVSLESYQRFYPLIEKDKSLENVTADVITSFNRPHVSRLLTTMREGENTSSKVFQVVEITSEDYFRVLLHSDQNSDQWAYFYQSNINNQVMQLFVVRG